METNSNIYKLIQLEFEGQLSEKERLELNTWMEESPDHAEDYRQIWSSLVLTERLAEMKKVDTKGDLAKVKAKFRKLHGMKRWLTNYQKIAAILLIPFVVYSIWSGYSNLAGSAKSGAMKSTETIYGVRSHFQLVDGTKVWLNSGSKLEYPENFKGNTREVKLQGEAYFEVESDSKHPFYVDLGGQKLKATGTAFNITNYKEGKSTFIFLQHGKVQLVSENGNEEVEHLKMKEGELAVFDREKREYLVNSNDGQRFLGWKEGKLIFRNDNMLDVATRLGYWYNAEIIVADKALDDFIFTATFKYETLEEALKLLSYSSPIKFHIEKAEDAGTGETEMKKVIIEKI